MFLVPHYEFSNYNIIRYSKSLRITIGYLYYKYRCLKKKYIYSNLKLNYYKYSTVPEVNVLINTRLLKTNISRFFFSKVDNL